ncbi:CDP-diacylglycerol--serine O-phosphatidyltransferase [Conyzicola lurida]|uniref:CDP-diacylglycerol--serine O-phosphatidyltransferase n=1 Tax=Conyzicola lurida TaxID=1172621 RepID=A0A841AK49_9MICO|nr:CDP-alcohol phosphatidyltransferase family protein [Conyzicola lurida]MBB5841845.1 CDP-diacylglycerol--serine O-phosphatidyltransferase [Conyzicola lurida]
MRNSYWVRTIGPAGAVSLLSLAVAWAAIGLAVVGSLRASVLCALLAFLLDMVDGYIARRCKVSSEFGRQLDSMIDVINYSVYAAVLSSFYLAPGILGWALGFVIVATGILRLLRFNIEGFTDDEPIKYYRGIVVVHLSLAAITLLLLKQWLGDVALLSVVVLVVLSVLQLSLIRIRKTGRQALWASLVVPLAVGAILWLR